MKLTSLGAADKARWERVMMRRPGQALPKLRALMRKRDPVVARAALQGAFFVLERWGRAAELQDELQAAVQQARQKRALPEAAELSEAQGRLHYQRGDYAQACNAWSQTLDWASDDSRSACLARIGLAHLCYALGDWARGGRVLDQAELHYPQLGQDPYLRAKIALNRAASLRATQGPQAALPALQEALSAAREAGHRDYQAEAIWHHARCARDSGDAALALQRAQEALALAQRCGYRWLQAQATLLISELQSGDAALGWAGQALALAEALQSRSLQAAAHGRLADLMREQGELGPSWHHAQQRQQLESTLNQGQLPARLEALARFDTDPTGADALLLELAGQAWSLQQPEDFHKAWKRLRPRLLSGLGLAELQLWWDWRGDGAYQRLPGGPSAKPLQAAQMPGYLAALAGPGAPLVCAEPAAHPWREELGEALQGTPSRLELGLQLDGRLVGLLWLQREAGAAWSRADIGRASRLAAWLERLLGQLDQALRRRGAELAQHENYRRLGLSIKTPIDAALGGAAMLAEGARGVQELLNREHLSRAELAALAGQLMAGAATLEQQLQRGLQLLAEFERDSRPETGGRAPGAPLN